MSSVLRRLTGGNLEVFKVRMSFTHDDAAILTISSQFGMYIMFPVGIMYYFGANLERRFAVPDFWPKEGQTHTIPFEREDIDAELQRLKERRLAARARRLALQERGVNTEHTEHQEAEAQNPRPDILEATKLIEPEKSGIARELGWKSWFR